MVLECYLKHFQVTNATEALFIGCNLFFFDFFEIKICFFDQMHFHPHKSKQTDQVVFG